MQKTVMYVIIVLIIGTNVVWALNGRPGDTYSEMIIHWASRSVFPPLAMGSVIGHWFFTVGITAPRYGFFMMLGIWIAASGVDALAGGWVSEHTHPAMWVFVGLALGCSLWSMS